VLYRFIAPGAEWRLHREWFRHSAVADLLGGDFSLADIFVSFLSHCLYVSLKARLRPLAAGLTVRTVLEKFASMQMLDVHMPTTDGREVILSRYTQPDTDLQLLLEQMNLPLPEQPPPRIMAAA